MNKIEKQLIDAGFTKVIAIIKQILPKHIIIDKQIPCYTILEDGYKPSTTNCILTKSTLDRYTMINEEVIVYYKNISQGEEYTDPITKHTAIMKHNVLICKVIDPISYLML